MRRGVFVFVLDLDRFFLGALHDNIKDRDHKHTQPHRVGHVHAAWFSIAFDSVGTARPTWLFTLKI